METVPDPDTAPLQVMAALRHVPFGLAVFGPNRRLIYSNTTFSKLLEATHGEISTGVEFATLRDRYLDDADNVADALVPSRNEHRTESGRTIACSCEPSGDGGIVVSLRDVTADRAADTVLRDSEARFRDLTEIASDWFWEMDADFRFTFISNRFFHLTDIPTTEVIGRHRGESKFTIPGQDAVIADNVETMRRRESFRDFRLAVQGRDGLTRTLSINGAPAFDPNGRFSGYRGTGRDLTEMENLSAALQTQRAQIKELMEHAPIPIIFKNPDLRFVIANEAFYAERGLSADQVIGKTSTEIFTDGSGDIYTDHDRAVIDRGEPVMREITVGSRIIRSYKFPVFGETGTLLGLGGVELDITDRVRESQALAVAKTEAERANKAKSYFLAKVSHELRTPLNAVIGFGEVLQTEVFGPLGGDRYRDYAKDIVSSGRHLLGLVSDILDISKIESDEMELHERVLDFSDLVVRAANVTQASKTTPAASVYTDRVAPNVMFYGDETALERIVMNLVGNALKFTKRDGRVEVSLSVDLQNRVTLTIRDNGIGIAQDKLQEVVQPFATGDNPLRLGYEGAGLGLAIVKALCTAHDATFSIQSEEGLGTTCVAMFPAPRLR